MKTVVIVGAGQMGQAVCDLINRNSMHVAAFGDNDPACRDESAAIPVLSVREALAKAPDLIIIGVLDAERCGQMKSQLTGLGYTGKMIALGELQSSFDIRGAALRKIAGRIRELGVSGAVAELGVYRGDFAWQLNGLFPDRRLYLFDTFEGFDERDIRAEPHQNTHKARAGFSDTGADEVLARMPHKAMVTVVKGHFPETAGNVTEREFALVSIDADLYKPTLAGLEYFYPRLSGGGVIILHDYGSKRFDGVQKAARSYEAEKGPFTLIPLCDLHGSAIIIKPFR